MSDKVIELLRQQVKNVFTIVVLRELSNSIKIPDDPYDIFLRINSKIDELQVDTKKLEKEVEKLENPS